MMFLERMVEFYIAFFAAGFRVIVWLLDASCSIVTAIFGGGDR